MPKFRKKPVVITAQQFTGGADSATRCIAFAGLPETAYTVLDGGPEYIYVDTLEGLMRADVGDWIIKGVKGEFYPCKPDIFAATYEEVEDRVFLASFEVLE